MRLFRWMAYTFAFFIGACFAFSGTNSFPAPPPKQYQPKTFVKVKSERVLPPDTSPTVEMGKTLFRTNCAACHNRNMKDNLTGPALGGSTERWSQYPREDLYRWIRNSQAMIEEGHPMAKKLWEEWGPTVMNAFPNLSDEEIDAILAYMDAVYQS